MAHNPPAVPPPVEWPVLYGPDCPRCGDGDHTQWLCRGIHLATGTDVHVWLCGVCSCAWPIRVTCWPVLSGPDCPYCQTPVTGWAAIDPDHLGDLWTCEDGHEFVVTPEGLIVLPEDA